MAILSLHDEEERMRWLTYQVDLAIADYYDGVTDGLDRVNTIDSYVIIEVQPGTWIDMLIDMHPDGRVWVSELDEPHSWRGTFSGGLTVISTPWEEIEVDRPIALVIAHHLYQRGW